MYVYLCIESKKDIRVQFEIGVQTISAANFFDKCYIILLVYTYQMFKVLKRAVQSLFFDIQGH